MNRCVFPACVDGERPEFCGDAVRAEVAEAALREIAELTGLWGDIGKNAVSIAHRALGTSPVKACSDPMSKPVPNMEIDF